MTGKKYYFSPLLLLLSLTLHAQEADTPHHFKLEPAFDFDQRLYYMQHEWLNVWGYREGIILDNKYKVGIGEYYMSQPVGGPPYPKNVNLDEPLSHRQQLYFGTLYFEPFLFRHEYLETSLVFEGGYGRTVNTFSDPATQNIYDRYNKYFIPAGAGVSVNLKFPAFFGWKAMRWFGVNFVAGYRTTLWQGDTVHDYNGFYWSISSAIFLDRIFDDLRAKKRSTNN